MPSYKDNNTGKWYCQFYYKDATGKRKKKMKRGFELKREADQWEREFLEKMQGSPEMLFSSMLELYLSDGSARWKTRTYHTRESRFRVWVLPYFKDYPVNEIKPTHIRNWQIWLTEQHTEKGTQLSPGYIQNLFRDLSSFFNFAVKFHDLPSNPCLEAGNIAGKRSRSLKFWTSDQFHQFEKTFDDSDPLLLAYRLLYYTGMRLGELEALTIGDIDTSSGVISISKSLQVERGQRTTTTTKTGKAREVTIPPFLCQEIESYKSRLYDYKPTDRLFLLARSRYGANFKTHTKKADLPEIRIHDLRHSHASLLIELGFSPVLIAERLGHDRVSTTLDIYSHLWPSKQNEVSDRLQKEFENKIESN